eukprot:6160418-Amphidinium_carterae.1
MPSMQASLAPQIHQQGCCNLITNYAWSSAELSGPSTPLKKLDMWMRFASRHCYLKGCSYVSAYSWQMHAPALRLGPCHQLLNPSLSSDTRGLASQAQENLRVQSISTWAMACIGPYSQAVRLGDLLLTSGVLGRVLSTLSV